MDAVGSGCLWLSHHRSVHQLLSTRVRSAARSTACVLYVCRCQPPQREGLLDTHTHTHTHRHGRPVHNQLGLMLLQWRRVDSAKGRGWHVMSTLSPQPKSNSVHFRFKTRHLVATVLRIFPKLYKREKSQPKQRRVFSSVAVNVRIAAAPIALAPSLIVHWRPVATDGARCVVCLCVCRCSCVDVRHDRASSQHGSTDQHVVIWQQPHVGQATVCQMAVHVGATWQLRWIGLSQHCVKRQCRCALNPFRQVIFSVIYTALIVCGV